ncbi:MAG TPA: tRNA 2-thiouridine(34) synthase MnmA [Vicinamibacterales bacterium]|nr:tRNA 2-thiouridine(34) synthase MnmA [Vicinamibacterales bacterium]
MRIVVAMSGGVDSSVAAALLAEQGHEVIGVSMQLYDQSESQASGRGSFGTCCTIDDLYDARRVAAAIGIPHYIVNFESRFNEQVVSNFIREYAAGRTPIPCAHCNADVKFATLLERALGFGADALATGHYARIAPIADGAFVLRRGLDTAKDQTYFLFSLTQEQLARAAFPVGHLDKATVRRHAERLELRVASKPDSQEICFVPDGDYATFIENAAPGVKRTGPLLDQDGAVIGGHQGVHRYTIGQRKGLGLSSKEPLYVLEIRPQTAEVVVGPRSALGRTTLTASSVNWVSGRAPMQWLPVGAQIRYKHIAAPARVRALDRDRAEVEFEDAQTAITPGQAVVFYDGDVCLGGGWID